MTKTLLTILSAIFIQAAIAQPICDSAFTASFTYTSSGNVAYFADLSNTTNQQAFYIWSFGDGTFDQVEDPIHTYSASGPYYVCLDIWYWNQNTQDSCWSSSCEWITVQGGNLSCDSITNTSNFSYIANGASVNFTNLSNTSGFPATYIWTFGDGSISDVQHPNHFYSQPGSYLVCLQTAVGINNGADSCFSFYCDSIYVDGNGVACDSTFQAAFTYTSSGNVAYFADLSNTANQQAFYIWSFGDGTFDQVEDPIHTYSASGPYYVCLDIWYWNQNTQDSCWSSSCEWITVQGGGNLTCDSITNTSDFNYLVNGSSVSFTNMSNTSGFPATYVWTFGDGSDSDVQHPNHFYSQPGSYLVCLQTAVGINNGADSCFSFYCDSIYVDGNGVACDSTFQAAFTYTSSGNVAYFADLSNTANQQAFYIWSFGDGTFDYIEDPIHTYSASGPYYVCLDIWYWNQNTQDSCWSSSCEWITIQGQGSPCDSLLEASFTWAGSGPTIQFEDLSYSAGVQTWYFWSFGDGSSSSDQDPVHIYAQTGVYWVCLTVNTVDQNGFQCTDSTCTFVTVSVPGGSCDSTFFTSFTAYDQGGNIAVFNATSNPPATGYIWMFGDGTIANGGPNTQHFYQQAGQYYVCLDAWYYNQNAQDTCWTSTCQWVTVSGVGNGCDSTFIAGFSYTSANNIGYFTDQSNTNGFQTNYYWDFGDGSFDWGQNPIHTYQQPGQYFACLEVWYWDSNAQDSCFSTACEWVTITQSTSIDEHYFSSTPIILFPNPGVGLVRLPADARLNNATLVVTDIRGRELAQFTSGALLSGLLDLRLLESGTYLFIFQMNEARRTERYLLEK